MLGPLFFVIWLVGYVAQADLKLSWSSCFSLPSAEITGVYHHAHLKTLDFLVRQKINLVRLP
jgi:hypothetical protein